MVFTVQATGTEPLRYNWQWKPTEEEGEWQPCPAEWSDGATLTIPSVQKSNEGSYCCVVSNCAGTVISKPAQLSVGKNLYFHVGKSTWVKTVNVIGASLSEPHTSRTALHVHVRVYVCLSVCLWPYTANSKLTH